MRQSVFRLGDIRGRYPEEINECFVRRFAPEFIHQFNIKTCIATGRDTRISSQALHNALNTSLRQHGINVLDLGVCATELGTFASFQDNIEAVIIITASHNVPEDNGLKCILNDGQATTHQSGLHAIENRMNMSQASTSSDKSMKGTLSDLDLVPEYVQYLTSRIHPEKWDFECLALNGLNGTASTLAVPISNHCKLQSHWYKQTPGPLDAIGVDPSHPKHAADMKQFMASSQFDFGVAWDGDSDRCVFFDETGRMIPAYYMVGIFAEYFLQQIPGAAIVFDTKLCWNTIDIIQRHSGIPVPSQTGHAFVIQQMKKFKAIYGGELSGHHYFGDFKGCDSGMMAWLMTMNVIQSSALTLEELVDTHRNNVKCIREISLSLDDSDIAIKQIMKLYSPRAKSIDTLDGISLEMPENWRFSLRDSKTESKIRLNLETKSSGNALLEEAKKLIDLLRPFMKDKSAWKNELILQ